MKYLYIFSGVVNAISVLLWLGLAISGVHLSTPHTLLVACNLFLVVWCVNQLLQHD